MTRAPPHLLKTETSMKHQAILDSIIGTSTGLHKVKEQIRKVAGGHSTVCINGESGTGKELFARALHQLSARSQYNFITVNCAAIPDALLESELFGYVEGAFTGAVKGGRQGKFEVADRGTIFFDEIADLQLHLQAKLLRVLQEGTVEKVGGHIIIPTNVRIVAASNKELHELVEKGLFREDLFYRLAVIPIWIPPLRSRTEDIMPLALHFLHKLNGTLGKKINEFDPEVVHVFEAYPWPGNVRELEHVIEYAVNMADGDVIFRHNLSSRFQEGGHRTVHAPRKMVHGAITPVKELIRTEILKAVKIYGKTRRGVGQAANALGISPATLYRKLKQYDQ